MKDNWTKHHIISLQIFTFKMYKVGQIDPWWGQFWPAGCMFDTPPI